MYLEKKTSSSTAFGWEVAISNWLAARRNTKDVPSINKVWCLLRTRNNQITKTMLDKKINQNYQADNIGINCLTTPLSSTSTWVIRN